ncbi:hypothetical protein LMZ02_17350 [Paenibacillus macerans]|uniref:hypothetical protein n=2 Tax=Paenibacillus macerans TaxID=44252 RepID=UPI001F0FE0FC|nr:hypothetical protein [Paenibacillus macerans]UMV45296.1 hypothetical protein LMZ02_17350 [Paenibacillus macerans]
MQLKKYPTRFHVRKVIEQFMSSRDSLAFFKEQGILIQANRRKDVAKIAADHYFSRSSFLKLKEMIETEHNYKKTARFELPKEQIVDLKDALLEINGISFKDEENTTVSVVESSQDDWKFIIDYTEYKPGLIDLLDQTARRVEVKVNYHQDTCSLDFDTNVSSDHKKFKQVIDYLVNANKDVRLDFSEISLKTLSCEKRIQLFNEFFQYDHHPWEFVEIKKLKVKRDDDGDKSRDSSEPNERIIEDDQLQGINSALIDGKNLIENKFVKGTLDNGFYFSMAQMRFDNIENSDFIDVAIEFLSRPEKCETKMVSSGYYFYDNDTGGILEETNVIEPKKQDPILFEFKNALFQIHRRLLTDQKTSFSAGDMEVKFLGDEATEEVAAAIEGVATEEVAKQGAEAIIPDEAQD